ncbi:uncharacterized protein METZ01_LOCUS449729, partial [marine metagenome]
YVIEDVRSPYNAEKLMDLAPNSVILDNRARSERFDDILIIYYKD